MDYLYVTVREATDEDIPAILELEQLCFKAPWNRQNILYEMHENPVANVWVIELEEKSQNLKSVVGFCDYWHTFDSATIAQIAVHPSLHRKQLGSAMMDEIINDCYAKKVRTLTLEVRADNEKAINFYLKHGFKKELVKPHYYSNGDDAIYMTRKVEDL